MCGNGLPSARLFSIIVHMIAIQVLYMLIASDFPICEVPAFQYHPGVVFGESLYYVFWSDLRYDGSIFAGRVSPQGAVLDTNGILLYQGNTIYGARAAFDGTNLLAVFRDSC